MASFADLSTATLEGFSISHASISPETAQSRVAISLVTGDLRHDPRATLERYPPTPPDNRQETTWLKPPLDSDNQRALVQRYVSIL